MHDKNNQFPLCHCHKHHDIDESLLGCCRYCRKAVTYNIYGYPECKHCDCFAVAAVCYHCGAGDQPVYAEVGIWQEKPLWNWICPACNTFRVDADECDLRYAGIARRLAECLPLVIWRIPRLRSLF